MQHQVTADIAAPLHDAWAVVADVERWPEWTASLTSVEWVEGDGLAVGSVAKVKQPRFPTMTWRVTEVDEGRRFTWVTRTPGAETEATHELRDAPGGARIVLSLDQRGWLGALVARLFARRSRSYMTMEAEGLRRAAEARLAADHPAGGAVRRDEA